MRLSQKFATEVNFNIFDGISSVDYAELLFVQVRRTKVLEHNANSFPGDLPSRAPGNIIMGLASV